jgi:hypothetical protein
VPILLSVGQVFQPRLLVPLVPDTVFGVLVSLISYFFRFFACAESFESVGSDGSHTSWRLAPGWQAIWAVRWTLPEDLLESFALPGLASVRRFLGRWLRFQLLVVSGLPVLLRAISNPPDTSDVTVLVARAILRCGT